MFIFVFVSVLFLFFLQITFQVRQDNHYSVGSNAGSLRLISKFMVLVSKRARLEATFSPSFPLASRLPPSKRILIYYLVSLNYKSPYFFLFPLNHFSGLQATEKVCVSLSNRLLDNITLPCFCLNESATLTGEKKYIK